MEQLSVILLVLLIMGADADGNMTVNTMTSSKACAGDKHCEAMILGCTQAGYDAVERVYRQEGSDKAQFVCVRVSLTDNN